MYFKSIFDKIEKILKADDLMKEKHIIDLECLNKNQLEQVITLSEDIMKNPKKYQHACDGKILATLFYEPSTRTQMSFQTAMLRLGGKTIGFDNPMNSSVAKGENLKDTITIVSGYADIIAMRHPAEGSARAASMFSTVPVINGGDGGHFHPTQTLTDVITLKNEKGRLTDLTIGLCGDLLNGRTVHSLIKTMSHFENNKFVLISTKALTIPQYIKDVLKKAGCEYKEVRSLKEAIPELDVLYMTRIQQERFATQKEYEEQKGIFVLDTAKMELAKKDMVILHPLPRVDEIEVKVDDDPRACYFKQAVYGMYGRMALIYLLLNDKDFEFDYYKPQLTNSRCRNRNCITRTESYLKRHCHYGNDGHLMCNYCDHIIE